MFLQRFKPTIFSKLRKTKVDEKNFDGHEESGEFFVCAIFLIITREFKFLHVCYKNNIHLRLLFFSKSTNIRLYIDVWFLKYLIY